MRKILAVIKREYLQIVRTKGFIIGTILGPVIMAAFIVIPIIAARATVGKQKTIGVIDLTQEVFEELDSRLDRKEFRMKDGQKRYLLEKYRLTADIDELRNSLRQKVLNGELSAYLFIPKDIESGGKAEYASEHVSDYEEIGRLEGVLNRVIIEKRLKKEELDPQKIAGYIKPIRLDTIKVTKRGEEKESGATFMISYFMMLILYISLFFYGAIIMRGVIEEKNSKVIEVMLSSLRPFYLMVGKILGIAAVGFTQFAIWALFGIAAFRYSKPLVSSFAPAASGFNLPSIPLYVFIYFVIFFILGYFLYGTFYAAIGSMVNSEKEAQQLQMPVTMFLVVPMLLAIFFIRTPDSSLAVILSMIPLFTPILMFLRISVLLPPFPQIAGSIVLLLLTILLMIWLTAKIYRVGILMYGKPPNLKEIVKWVRYG